MKLPFVGAGKAQIRRPKRNKRGQIINNWYGTTLPWMSIGYETQIPPIYTLTFYNAIANNGRMVAPRFVKSIMKDGEVLKDFPTVVLKEKICKDKTLKEMQTILYHVVSQGLGKRAGSQSFKVAGKTGTAQISKGKSGYKNGQMNLPDISRQMLRDTAASYVYRSRDSLHREDCRAVRCSTRFRKASWRRA